METEPDNRPADPGEACLERGLEVLRANGFKLTRQRRAILELFGEVGEHLKPSEIYDRLESSVPSLSRATVYNTLELFEEEGIVSRVTGENGETYFDPNVDPHHHGVCRECGQIFDMEITDDSLSNLTTSTETADFEGDRLEVDEAVVWFRGICRACQSDDSES